MCLGFKFPSVLLLPVKNNIEPTFSNMALRSIYLKPEKFKENWIGFVRQEIIYKWLIFPLRVHFPYSWDNKDLISLSLKPTMKSYNLNKHTLSLGENNHNSRIWQYSFTRKQDSAIILIIYNNLGTLRRGEGEESFPSQLISTKTLTEPYKIA